MKNFKSFLAPQLNEYLIHRQTLGYSIKVSRSHLLVFDKYLRQTNADWDVLTPFFFLEMRTNLQMESRSVNRILSSVRVFFHFLLQREHVKENPLRDIPFLKENSIIPFVFSSTQTDQLLEILCNKIRKDKKHFLADFAIYLALLLQARCGMRISEPLKLMNRHYQMDDGTIYIEKTKFKKQRIIPVPKTVKTEIENYQSVRKQLDPVFQNPYLLAGIKEKPLTEHMVRSGFSKAVRDIGLEQPKRIIGNMNFSQPTTHSLRHSFAVNTLLNIKKRGGYPQNALPVLAAYMGHSEYRYTSIYLRVSDAMSRKNLVDFALWQKRKE